jgi:serine protease AprX
MKKLLFLLVIFFSFSLYAQEDAWVYFNNKPNAQFYFDNPLQMLSQRALNRRAVQQIPLDIKDVPIHQPYVDQIAAVNGIVVKAKSKWFNALHIRGSVSEINSLSNLSFVGQIRFADNSLNQANRVINKSKIKPVNKIMETSVSFPYGSSANQIQMLNGHMLHQQDYTGAGKIIAVMDAGFPGVNTIQPFQRIRDNNQILGGYNFVDGNSNFYTGNSHGTSVLSTISGYIPNQLVGTAPDSQVYLFITEDVNSENPVEESYWVEAAEVADSLGVDIINTSLGYFEYDNPNYSYNYSNMNGVTSYISRGADVAFSRGMICVTSGGNSGATSNPYISVPADAINTLTVGAVKSDETYATFSSIGPSFDGRIKPDVMAQGQSSVITNLSGTITTGSGTSFSGPIMAGMVACLWQAIPGAKNSEIIQFIKQSADRYTNPNAQYGYGIPDFQMAINISNLDLNNINPKNFILYPNPVENIINVRFPNDYSQGQITIFNSQGQTVLNQYILQDSVSISAENWMTGLYFYKIVTGNKIIKGKFLKK